MHIEKIFYCILAECNDSSSSDDEDEEESEDIKTLKELEIKQNHPDRLHPDLWHNEPGEVHCLLSYFLAPLFIIKYIKNFPNY